MRLDRTAIARAALDLMEEEGIDGVSTRRLADRLGVKGPSLYWHFRNKGELLAHMSGLMFAEALPEAELGDGGFDWAEWLARGARGLRKTALSRRDGAILMAKSRPVGLGDAQAAEKMIKSLRRSGLSEKDAQMAMLTLGRFALGWVLYEQTAAPRQTLHGGDEGFEFGLQVFLAGLKQMIGH